MIIVIISIVFVLIVATAIFLPMIFHSQKLKAACNTDADCAKGSKCVLDPNTKRKTCIPESKKFCSMFENNLTPCNLETDSVCKECESGPDDIGWACQSSLWDAEKNKPRNSCKPSPSPSPSLKPCKPGTGGTCENGCSENEICIPPSPSGGALGPNVNGGASGRCSLPRTWHKSKILCDGNDEKSIRDCKEKCGKVLGEWENEKCIVFEKTVVPPGSVHPLDNTCEADSDCNAKNGELCANGKCAQIQGWCQIPLQKPEDCNEYTGTYTLRQNTDTTGKTTYEWVCLCDTNLFDRGTEGSSCINLTGCQGQTGQVVYIPEINDGKKVCGPATKCDGESKCINGVCYIPWEGKDIINSRSPYPCVGDNCGYGVKSEYGGSVCDCGPNGITKVVNLLPDSQDSKLWYMYCEAQDECRISGGSLQGNQCLCPWPLTEASSKKKSCLPDPCFPGYTTSDGVCFCPNQKKDPSHHPQYGPTPMGTVSWWWDPKDGMNFYPYLSDEGPICSPICEDNPCGDNGTCVPTKDNNGSYYRTCNCDCGAAGEFCQYASADNNIPPGSLCEASSGAPVCCGAPSGTSAESDENPCVVGRLSPFVRAGLSDSEKELDNNPDGNHEGYKLGFCYKPCGKAGPGGKIDPHTPDPAACADDESCVLLPRNAYKFTSNQSDVKDFRAYCTKNIPDFDNSNHSEAGPSCYANSFKLNEKGENDICTDWGSSSSDKNTCASFYFDGTGGLANQNKPSFSKNSSLCCFNNPRGQTGSPTILPTCLYDCDGSKSPPFPKKGNLDHLQSNCDKQVHWPFWDVSR